MIKFLIPARWDFPMWVVWDQNMTLLSEQVYCFVLLAIFLKLWFLSCTANISLMCSSLLSWMVLCNDDTLLPSSLWDYPLWVVMICAFPLYLSSFDNLIVSPLVSNFFLTSLCSFALLFSFCTQLDLSSSDDKYSNPSSMRLPFVGCLGS